MILADILLEVIAPSIAEKIFQLWIGNTKDKYDPAHSLAETISLVTENPFDRRKVLDRFNRTGAMVAENLQTVFMTEGSTIDDATKEAIAHEVGLTLHEARITTELLVQNDLDPKYLLKHISSSRQLPVGQFSAVETSLYERVLNEISYYIIKVTSRLPYFSETAFAEILERETKLLDIVTAILDEVRKIREDTHQSDLKDDDASFETQYRLAASYNLNEVELFGTPPNITSVSKRYPLSVAYITLEAKEYLGSNSRRYADQHFDDELVVDPTVDNISDDDAILRVDELLARNQRLLIKGLAGSGKTTLLKWIAYCASAKRFEGLLEYWNDKVPFFIKLRRFPDGVYPSPDEFPNEVVSSLKGKIPSQWIYRILNKGRAIILIDGVDEVSNRNSVRLWIRDLVNQFQ